tara:strand:+ start:4889 stop:5662 length:774 start_codon:yes stop_codon:yes gene_type:complete
MSDEPNTNIFADEIFADKITATESIEVEQINSKKVIISGELDAATITGDGSKLTGVLNGFTFPSVDGSSGDVIQTNGNKALSFATPTQWTVHADYDMNSGSVGFFEATGLNNPREVKIVFHKIRHSLGGRNHMFIGDTGGYYTSKYYDVGRRVDPGLSGNGVPVRVKRMDQSNWFPLDYNAISTSNLYSGSIILSRAGLQWSYFSNLTILHTNLSDMYDVAWKGFNDTFVEPLDRVKLENGNGGVYNNGYLTILSQR